LKAVTLAGSALAVPALVAPALADDKNATAPWIEKFAAATSDIPLVRIVKQAKSVHDVASLSQLGG